MEVRNPNVRTSDSGSLLTLRQAASSGERAQWQVGQVLRATVSTVNQQGGIRLNIGGAELASTNNTRNLDLQPGQQLRLQVVSGGRTPVLQVLDSTPSAREVAAQASRQALPRQAPLNNLLDQLVNLTRAGSGNGPGAGSQAGQAGGGQTPALSAGALNQLRQVVSSLPGADKVTTPEGLKQAIRDSGQFLEAKLAQQIAAGNQQGGDAASVARDLKAAMLRLLNNLQAQQQQQAQAPGARGAAPTPTTPQPQAGASPANPAPLLYTRGGQPQATGTAPQPAPQAAAAAAQGSTAAGQTAVAGQQQAAGATQQQAAQAAQTGGNTGQQANAAQQQGAALAAAAGRGAGDLAQQVESGLARIQMNQLATSQTTDSSGRPAWYVEIPVRGGNDDSVHVMQLRIEQEREGDGGDVAPLWTVTLNFELEKLGSIRAGITLIGQRHVSVGLWAENEETVALFDEHLSTLHERMAEAGLTVGHLGVRRGERPAEPDEHTRTVPGPLVDEQA